MIEELAVVALLFISLAPPIIWAIEEHKLRKNDDSRNFQPREKNEDD